MKFSLYSEIQSWPGKSAAQLYGEVLEQITNADRLGYDAYAVIEHFFFPKFSISASPLVLFAAAAQRTRDIVFRTLLHSMPYHNPVVLASEIAVADIILDGRYEFGVGRGHGWMPPKAGLRLTPESREWYEEAVELLFTALENERFSYDGSFWKLRDVVVEPRPVQQPGPPIWVAAGSEGSVTSAATRGHRLLLDQFTDVEGTSRKLEWYRAGCVAAGRPFDAGDVALTRGLLVLDTADPRRREEAIRRRSRGIRMMAESARIPGTEHTQEHSFFDDSPETIEATAIIGTPSECIERLLALHAIGVEYVLFSDFSSDVESLELFAKEVMPALA